MLVCLSLPSLASHFSFFLFNASYTAAISTRRNYFQIFEMLYPGCYIYSCIYENMYIFTFYFSIDHLSFLARSVQVLGDVPRATTAILRFIRYWPLSPCYLDQHMLSISLADSITFSSELVFNKSQRIVFPNTSANGKMLNCYAI
jgi:hypothetical protein